MTRIGDKYKVIKDEAGKDKIVLNEEAVYRGLDASTRAIKRGKRKNGRKYATRSQAMSVKKVDA